MRRIGFWAVSVTGLGALFLLAAPAQAELVIAPCARPRLVLTETLPPTPRGTGGFGHTGMK